MESKSRSKYTYDVDMFTEVYATNCFDDVNFLGSHEHVVNLAKEKNNKSLLCYAIDTWFVGSRFEFVTTKSLVGMNLPKQRLILDVLERHGGISIPKISMYH